MRKIVYVKLNLLITGCLLFMAATLNAQKLDSTLATYGEKYQSERAYLHYDKSTYSPGETIWFTAYVMQGITAALESKTLYIDWVDDNGTVLMHTVSPLVDGISNGQFDIPGSFTGNTIHVQAYTKWMLNFDSAFLYHKDIPVIAKAPASVAKPATAYSLQFFPEGGDAIAGISNRIAFKVTDQWGRPAHIKGVVQAANGTVVDSLRVKHDGMGSFILIPQAGTTYTARWKDAKGAEHTTSLPTIRPNGISMQVAVTDNKQYFNINRTDNAPENLKALHLVGTLQQHLVFKANVSLTDKATVGGIIPTNMLPSGILTITVFDNNWNAVAERITFVNNHDYSFPTEMDVQHWGLNKRARNEIQIRVPDSIIANLSVSVTDAAIERDSSNTIISQLLLTNDIKGYVYRPAYYFSNNSDSVRQQLDLVMMTNGWRRFKWEDVVQGKLPTIRYPKDTAYLSLSGRLYGFVSKGLGTTETLPMFVKQKDSSAKMVLVPIEPNGTFNNPDMIFFDTLKIYYKPGQSLQGTDVRFMEGRLPPLHYSSFPNSRRFYDTTGSYRHYALAEEQRQLIEQMKGKVLETVTVQAKTKPPLQVMDEKYAHGLFSGGDSYQFDLVNDPTAQSSFSIFNYLQGKVAGLMISTGNTGLPSLQWRGGNPQLFVDEIPTDVSMVSSIPVTDVAYIKVFRPPFIGASGGGSGGAIAIYTRKGSDARTAPGKGLSSNTIAGYTPVKEFYAPNYGTFDPRNEQRDVRTTLYWNPQVILSPQKHSVTLTFYNNDVSNAFHVVIEGMTQDGLLTHSEQDME